MSAKKKISKAASVRRINGYMVCTKTRTIRPMYVNTQLPIFWYHSVAKIRAELYGGMVRKCIVTFGGES